MGTTAREAGGGQPRPSLAELFLVFARLSLLGFGGPQAHLALMLDEVVERRRWLGREHFLQLVGITNLLPGPNSSEVAIHIGYTQRGWAGAFATGLAFLLPTFLIVLGLSWAYFGFGALPGVEGVLRGIKPAVLAVIVWAGVRLGRTAVRDGLTGALAVAGALVAWLAGSWATAAMVAGGAFGWARWRRRSGGDSGGEAAGEAAGEADRDSGSDDAAAPPSGGARAGAALLVLPAAAPAAGVLGSVFLTHLGIGSVLFGGGYVLVALLEPHAVGRHGWLTATAFLDGVAITQAVPGPISTLAAFVGYAAAGVPGAVAATAGIYLPAFVAVLLVAPHLERARALAPVKAALEGVSAVVAGAILGVAAGLAPAAVPDAWSGVILLAALLAAARFRVAAGWIVLGGLAAGAAWALTT